MIGRLTAALIAAALALPAPASAQVIELTGGEWVEGVLKEATSAGVVVEVGGQTVRFGADRVRAIYFAAPAPPPPPPTGPPDLAPSTPAASPAPSATVPPELSQPSSPVVDALQVLKALRAATVGAMNLREYQTKVARSAAAVDRYLAAVSSGPERDTIRDAMRYHVLAASAWDNQGAASRTVWLKRDDTLDRCTAYLDFARAMREKGEAFYAERLSTYVVISDGVIPVLWACASDKIGETELLLTKDKTSAAR